MGYSIYWCDDCGNKWENKYNNKKSKCYNCNKYVYKSGYYYFHCYDCKEKYGKKTWRAKVNRKKRSKCDTCGKFIPLRVKRIKI